MKSDTVDGPKEGSFLCVGVIDEERRGGRAVRKCVPNRYCAQPSVTLTRVGEWGLWVEW